MGWQQLDHSTAQWNISCSFMINFILLFSRQGKLRLQKWYEAKESKEKKKITRELTSLILQRKPKMCNFIEYKDLCVVYKRYASLFFCFAVDRGDNELGVLEVIHRCHVIFCHVFCFHSFLITAGMWRFSISILDLYASWISS